MRALIVDDIFTNRLLLAEIMRTLGHDYLEVENGRQAIDAILEEDFDIVMMDIEMPVMNGLETTKYIREELPHPKNRTFVVALTAHNPQLFFEDFRGVGFDQLLVKPYSIEKIASLMDEIKAR
jgi:CheY-like chemotaxis protein